MERYRLTAMRALLCSATPLTGEAEGVVQQAASTAGIPVDVEVKQMPPLFGSGA